MMCENDEIGKTIVRMNVIRAIVIQMHKISEMTVTNQTNLLLVAHTQKIHSEKEENEMEREAHTYKKNANNIRCGADFE